MAAAALAVCAAPASAAVVSVTLDGAGTGKVTSNPPGISCSNIPGALESDCSFEFPDLTVVALSASAPDGSVFKEWSGTAGGSCAGPTNPCTTVFLFMAPLNAVATFAPAPDAPIVTTAPGPSVAFPSATLSGTVNPNSAEFATSECYFEYGLTTEYGRTTPCRPGIVGPGTSLVTVSANTGALEPDTVYHYRIVAKNAGGVSAGVDRTVTGAAAPVDDCPNAAIRAQQHVLARTLPDCMAYELVSPERTQGQDFTMNGLSGDDELIAISAGGFADTQNLPDAAIQYHTSRTEQGWRTSAIAPPAIDFPFIGSGLIDRTDDMRTTLWRANLREDKGTQRFTPIVREPDGTFAVVGPTFDDAGKSGPSTPAGTSSDLRTLVVRTRVRAGIMTDGTVQSRSASADDLVIVRPTGAGQFSVSQVAYRAGATMLPNCTVRVGGLRSARGAVSADANQVIFYFSGLISCTSAANQRVWAKIGANDPVDLSASQCTTNCGVAAATFFEGASRDGSRVYFTTDQKLLDADEDTSLKRDLYEYDANATGSKLRSVTASALPEGAGVLGVTRISEDGSYVYFVANGRPLTEEPNDRGLTPHVGGNNLYVYHRPEGASDGETSFIGSLSSSDVDTSVQFSLLDTAGRAVYPTADGRYLLFPSSADLTGDRAPGDVHKDLFRYDNATGDLRRIWSDDPAHNGSSRSHATHLRPPSESYADGGKQQSWRGQWLISDDGATIALETAERLSPEDTNDQRDTYMWRENTGRLTLLSDGSSPVPASPAGVSRSGDTVLFNSTAPMTRGHTSAAVALFAARVGGGFAEPPAPPTPCSGDWCQGASSEGGAVASPGSAALVGRGNLARPKAAPRLLVLPVKAARGAATRVRVRVHGKGMIRVSGAHVGRTSTSAGKAGTYRVLVKLSKRARAKLARAGRLKVSVVVRFSPTQGKRSQVRLPVTFKAKQASRSVRRATVLSSDSRKGR
jgi:hypothetical protein